MIITQREVARRARVSQATVSLALRNHPSLPKKTRERVRALASSLGYRPDPALVALSRYRQKLRTPTFHGSIAFLVSDVAHVHWKSEPACWRLLDGAKEAAEK